MLSTLFLFRFGQKQLPEDSIDVCAARSRISGSSNGFTHTSAVFLWLSWKFRRDMYQNDGLFNKAPTSRYLILFRLHSKVARLQPLLLGDKQINPDATTFFPTGQDTTATWR